AQRQRIEPPPFPRSGASPTQVVVEVTPPAIDLAGAKRALNKRNFAEAERLLEEAVDHLPHSPEAHTLRGVLHECLGQSHAAYQSYRTALLCSSGYTPALNNLKRYCDHFGLDFRNKAINPAAVEIS